VRRPLLLMSAYLLAHSALAADEAPAWRGVWEWSMDKRSDAGLVEIAESCRKLGFNVLMMSPPRDKIEFMAGQCHQRGVRLYLSTVFSGGEPDWRQVMTPAEQERADQDPPPSYQHGGEPRTRDEVFRQRVPCWNRDEVRTHFRKKVVDFAHLPVDGLAFDAVGYSNYYRCYCPLCEAKLADYRREHPELSDQKASAACAEQAMVDFINEMAQAAREARPGIELTIHIWPYFRPNPYYGNRLAIDYVGQTVSWFFRPHWPLDKVRRLTKRIVARQHDFRQDSHAAPFIGFYSDPPELARSADRVRAELEIIRASGAEGMQVAELGHVVRAPSVARAVAEMLGGTPDAFPQIPEQE
jgi:hypothetical protein